MRVVTGNKYPVDRWIVVDDDDNVIFDPGNSNGHSHTLKLCNVYVEMPEHREEMHRIFDKND